MTDCENRTIPDPAVPMIRLPEMFKSRRINVNTNKTEQGYVEIMNVRACGCIRHIWLLISDNDRIEITVDDAKQPQVDMPLQAFFGVMHGWKPYPVSNMAFTVLPNFETSGMPGHPGYNCYLPIPFAISCRIRIYYPVSEIGRGCGISCMIDWQEYEDLELTPYRFYAQHTLMGPAPKRGGEYTVLDREGQGFVAGIVQGFMQYNFTDMIYHTGGMTILLDGESDPYPLIGHNVEDDYGFTWGFHPYQTPWIGCPYFRWGGRCDQDGTVYRFFGPDPIRFNTSISFRCGCRDDHVETVVYYYAIPDTHAPAINTPREWEIIGMMEHGNVPDVFARKDDLSISFEQDGRRYVDTGHKVYQALRVKGNRGWINFRYAGYEEDYFYTYYNRSAYARTTVCAHTESDAIVRLAFCNDLILYINGEQVLKKRHETFSVHILKIGLRRGKNEILIKTNCLQEPPFYAKAWVVHFSFIKGQKGDK